HCSGFRDPRSLHSFPTRRSSDLFVAMTSICSGCAAVTSTSLFLNTSRSNPLLERDSWSGGYFTACECLPHKQMQEPYRDIEPSRSEEHTSELQSLRHLVCRLLLE